MRISMSLPRVADVVKAADYLKGRADKVDNICKGLIWEAAKILEENLKNSFRAAGYDKIADMVQFWHFHTDREVSQIVYPAGYYRENVSVQVIVNTMEKRGAGLVHRAVAQSQGACLAKMQSEMERFVAAWGKEVNIS